MATKADGLSVKVKVNEAEMKLTQVEDGLSLSKMVLCQLCGIPLNEDIRLAGKRFARRKIIRLSIPGAFAELTLLRFCFITRKMN